MADRCAGSAILLFTELQKFPGGGSYRPNASYGVLRQHGDQCGWGKGFDPHY